MFNRLYYYFENKRRDKMVLSLGSTAFPPSAVENEEFLDRTDREDWVKFRYEW